MINSSDILYRKILIIDDSEADLLQFWHMLSSVIVEVEMNILPKAGCKGFHRTLK
jgi:hypothetical protein